MKVKGAFMNMPMRSKINNVKLWFTICN